MSAGLKYDSEKPRWNLLPLATIEQVVKVMTFGAKKYGPNNWQELEDAQGRYSAALMRHLTQWQSGQKIDKESGLPHLAHVCTNAVFLLWFELRDMQKEMGARRLLCRVAKYNAKGHREPCA